MAATIYTATQYAAFIKDRFPQRQIDTLVNFGKPFLSALPKKDDLVGRYTYFPVETDQPQGIAHSLTGALNNVSSTAGIQFRLTRAKGYGLLTIDGETMIVTRDTEGAWFKAREREAKGMFDQLGQELEKFLWRDGTGSIGQLAADPGTGTTFTLATPADAIGFHEQMKIVFYDNDGTGNGPGTVRAGGSRTVTGVNYSTGVITVSAALDAALDASDHVVRYSGGTAATDLNLEIAGVPAWIPASDPTDTFFNVARTLYPQKLGGHRQSWLGSIEETVKRLDSSIRRVNQRPKTLWLSYQNFHRLEVELGARAIRTEDGKQGVFNRASLMMASPGGGVEVKTGPYVPEGAGFLLDMSTWELHHAAGLPHVVQDDGNMAMRIGAGVAASIEDSIEIRYRWLAQLLCTNPFANGRAEIL